MKALRVFLSSTALTVAAIAGGVMALIEPEARNR
jgi:hypothetical protein